MLPAFLLLTAAAAPGPAPGADLPPRSSELGLPEPAKAPSEAGARLLWGVAVQAGVLGDAALLTPLCLATGPPCGWRHPDEPAGGVGLDLQLGAQLNDLWSFEAEASAGTNLTDGYLRGALEAGYTPGDEFTVAFGPFTHVGALVQGGFAWIDGVGGTVLLDLHVAPSRVAGVRQAFTVSLAFDAGETVAANVPFQNGIAVGAYLSVGWMRY